jgi:4-azaleucine resistance transporter AzlC
MRRNDAGASGEPRPRGEGAHQAWAAVKAAFPATLPVLLGYSTIGIAFGLLLVKAGLPWWLAPVMSVVIYAGAAQFMAVGLLASGTGLLETAILTLVINARHMVYGLSLLDRYAACKRFKAYLVYALTDETFGILTTTPPPEGSEPEPFYVAVSALDQSYWLLGSVVGALAGGLIPPEYTRGLDFALTALFVVLLVEQTKSVKKPAPYLVAAASTIAAFFLVGPKNLLAAAIVLSIAGILVLRRKGDGPASPTRSAPGRDAPGRESS